MTTTSQARRSALLSEASSRDARSLVRWTAPELEAVARAVNDALARAARRWDTGEHARAHLAALEAAGEAARHAEDADAALRSAHWTALGAHAHSALAGDSVQRLRDGLFGEPPVSPGARDGQRIADELAAECLAEQRAALQALLADALAGAADAVPVELAQAWQRWSGAVVVEAPWFGTAWRVLLDATAVRALLRALNLRRPARAAESRATPLPALRALAKTPVGLQVRLAPVDIDLGSLMSLGVGDVLRLGHAVDEPVHVVSPDAGIDAAPLCHGWLGGCDGAVALELARPRSGAKTIATP